MSRVIYLCPADDTPTGGVKVIYRHAETLNTMGVDAYVLHPLDTSFRCTWFDHEVNFLNDLSLDARHDFVVIPEIWAPIFAPQCLRERVCYAIFAQNGYMTHPVLPQYGTDIYDAAYLGADLILSISTDTTEMVRLNYPGLDAERIVAVQYSVHERFLSPHIDGSASRLITYMPRKMAGHAARVVTALRRNLRTDWVLAPIHGVDEETCAAMLYRSSIFLSFSDFEGLPLPPLEAALSGNIVVGYTGQGAKDYWRPPIFHAVAQGDVIGFVEAARATVEAIEAGHQGPDDLRGAREILAQCYSRAAERSCLAALLERIAACFQRAEAASGSSSSEPDTIGRTYRPPSPPYQPLPDGYRHRSARCATAKADVAEP